MLSERRSVRVALLGGGTVGREVARALLEPGSRFASSGGGSFTLAGIAVRDVAAARRRGLPEHLLTDAPAHLVASPETDIVVELMGGEDPAYTLIAAALGAGRPVVTANKHVVAHHGPELEALARRTGTAFRFEAAVGGGIPILAPLATDLAANEVRRVRGIVNGTTNFILTLMSQGGRTYAEALEEAKVRGYAEADPTGDVEGDDAVNKIVILTRLAFGEWVDPSSVVRCPPTARGLGRPGVTGIRDAEIEGVAALGLAMRLVATASRPAEDAIVASVLPTCVASASPLGRTDGVTNLVEVEGDPIGAVRMAGPGAGGPETSSAVLADILAIARGAGSTWGGLPPAATSPSHPGTSVADRGLPSVRPWFAWLPVSALDGRELPEALGSSSARVRDGTAIRTRPSALEVARAAFGAVLPPDVDVTLYPCDD